MMVWIGKDCRIDKCENVIFNVGVILGIRNVFCKIFLD